jgi:hypothetical protein
MEKTSLRERVKNEVLRIAKEQTNILHRIKHGKDKSDIMHSNCHLKHIIKKDKSEEKRRRERRSQQLLYDLK